MTRISNYTELVAERIRLEAELQSQKSVLKTEMKLVKEKFDPLIDIISALGIFKRKDSRTSSLLKTGLSVGIDLLVRDNLLSKASWIARTLLPVVLKGVSNQLLKKKAT
ncbi:MAG TPA: hypothetical protein PLJ60_11815 [Chryseolinea sp.]|nr:hypothetical protein [Chryseolinea sp.]HPM31010.1 hypothetical protein [Chryseolinea sp.]